MLTTAQKELLFVSVSALVYSILHDQTLRVSTDLPKKLNDRRGKSSGKRETCKREEKLVTVNLPAKNLSELPRKRGRVGKVLHKASIVNEPLKLCKNTTHSEQQRENTGETHAYSIEKISNPYSLRVCKVQSDRKPYTEAQDSPQVKDA